jgi:hypothetical protein
MAAPRRPMFRRAKQARHGGFPERAALGLGERPTCIAELLGEVGCRFLIGHRGFAKDASRVHAQCVANPSASSQSPTARRRSPGKGRPGVEVSQFDRATESRSSSVSAMGGSGNVSTVAESRTPRAYSPPVSRPGDRRRPPRRAHQLAPTLRRAGIKLRLRDRGIPCDRRPSMAAVVAHGRSRLPR